MLLVFNTLTHRVQDEYNNNGMKSTRNKFEVTPMMVMQIRKAANPIFSKRISDV